MPQIGTPSGGRRRAGKTSTKGPGTMKNPGKPSISAKNWGAKTMGKTRKAACAAAGLALLGSAAALQASAPLPPDEEGEPITLTAPKPNWVYVDRGFTVTGTAIYDSENGKMLGMVEGSWLSDLAIDPNGKAYYVAETMWTKGFRGTRQDMITVYDANSLALKTEIAMPGRILIGSRKHNFVLSDEGKTAYVYNLDPASSVNVVDLAKGKFVKKIELPGCASLMPIPRRRLFRALFGWFARNRDRERRQARHHTFGPVLLGHERSDLR